MLKCSKAISGRVQVRDGNFCKHLIYEHRSAVLIIIIKSEFTLPCFHERLVIRWFCLSQPKRKHLPTQTRIFPFLAGLWDWLKRFSWLSSPVPGSMGTKTLSWKCLLVAKFQTSSEFSIIITILYMSLVSTFVMIIHVDTSRFKSHWNRSKLSQSHKQDSHNLLMDISTTCLASPKKLQKV